MGESPFVVVPETPPEPRRLAGWGQPPPGSAVVVPEEPELVVVPYFGHDIRVLADPLSLTLVMEEFLDMAAQLEGTEDLRAVGAIRTFLRSMIAPQDFNEFWRLVKTNRQGLEEQMAFGKWLVESLTGHPTDEPSVSSPGPSTTQPRSVGDASSRAKARLEESGRPDLAEAVLLRRDYQAAKAQLASIG